jgi:hypothetical protein
MAFGEHLRPSAQPEVDPSSTSESVSDEPMTKPEGQESGEVDATPSGAPSAADGSLSDPDLERAAHLLAFQRVLQDVVELRTLQGDTRAATRVPLVAKGLMDYRNQKVDLAELCDQVIDQDYFRVPQSANGPHETENGSDRWTMTPENQAAEKSANLETAQMIRDRVEQSGVNLDLVAERFQSLLERADADSENIESPQESEAPRNLPVLVNEPVFGPKHGKALRVFTEAEYREIPDQKAEGEDKEDDEDDELSPEARHLSTNLVLLSMHMSQARTRRELRQAQAKAVPAQPHAKNAQQGYARSFSLPRPRSPEAGVDYEAFVRNRRTGQMLAMQDALMKLDRLAQLRDRTTQPDARKPIDDELERQAKRMLRHGRNAFDRKGLDLLARGGADPQVVADTLHRMEKWNRMFGRKDELERSPSDSLRQALEKLAQWIQEVVHRVIGRGSAQTSHQNPNAENRP